MHIEAMAGVRASTGVAIRRTKRCPETIGILYNGEGVVARRAKVVERRAAAVRDWERCSVQPSQFWCARHYDGRHVASVSVPT